MTAHTNLGTPPGAAHTDYEFRRLHLPRTTSRTAAVRLLTDQAEYGSWELARLRLRPDGSRDVLLRRTILRWRRPERVTVG